MKSKLQHHIDNIKAYEMGEIDVDAIVEQVIINTIVESLILAAKERFPMPEWLGKPFPPGGIVSPVTDEWITPTHNYQKKIFPVFNPDKYVMAYCDENGEDFFIELGNVQED